MDSGAFLAIKEAYLQARAERGDDQARYLAELARRDPETGAEVQALLAFEDRGPLIREPQPDPVVSKIPEGRALIGAVLAERYELQALAAEGGFGWVFRARDLVDEAPVAVKLFKPISHAGDAARVQAAFDREGQLLSSLAAQTPHIVAYRDVGGWPNADGRTLPFIVMEWLDGPTLRTYASTHLKGGAPLDALLTLLSPLAQALGAVHAAGVAHRDIKPDNILCAGTPAEPVLKLIDFGAAKRAADRARGFESTTGALGMITYRYSAPEQLDRQHGPTGPWTDVFAFALMIVELMSGGHPWSGLDVVATMDAILDPKRRPTPKRAGLEVPDPIEATFARALCVDPRRRHADLEAFWEALTAGGESSRRRGWLRRR